MAKQPENEITFYEHAIPAVRSGRYNVKVDQKVNDNEEFSSEKSFYIEGPQFGLDPAGVYSTYPPANLQAQIKDSLPHVVLKQYSLPWLRKLKTNQEAKDPTPWLAVLLVHEKDEPQPEFNAAANIGELKKAEEKVLPFQGAITENIHKETAPCMLLKMDVQLFKQIAPTEEDLKYLAHVKAVHIGNKEQSLDDTDNPETDDQQHMKKVGVVVGNRLPQLGKNTAYLVALEQMDSFLPDQDGKNEKLDNYEKVKLVCLHHWTFEAINVKKGIAEVAGALNLNPITLQLPAIKETDEDTKRINKAFQQGYVPMAHHLRTGEQTLSWYRGPLVCYPIKKRLFQHINTADAVNRYNPHTGMFDNSYSSAWQLGRLLGMSNQGFSGALYRWKQELNSSFFDKANAMSNDIDFRDVFMKDE